MFRQLFIFVKIIITITMYFGERSASVVKCLTRDREVQVQASQASLCCGP